VSSAFSIIDTGMVHVKDLQAKLDKAAKGEVKKRLRKALANSTKQLRREIVEAEREYLPSGMQKKYLPLPALTFKVTGDVIEVGLKQRKAGTDMKALNRGIVRHPLFGMRAHWYEQGITPGMWTVPLQVLGPRAIEAADRTIAAWAEGEFRG